MHILNKIPCLDLTFKTVTCKISHAVGDLFLRHVKIIRIKGEIFCLFRKPDFKILTVSSAFSHYK